MYSLGIINLTFYQNAGRNSAFGDDYLLPDAAYDINFDWLATHYPHFIAFNNAAKFSQLLPDSRFFILLFI